MDNLTALTSIDDSKMPAAALKAVFNILDKWGCSASQIMRILHLSKTAYYTYRKHPEKAALRPDQLERCSYLLNIHAKLRAIFDNPKNVYGFMAMQNHNAYFNGSSPLAMISTGDLAALHETYKQLERCANGY